jgi:chemosensory pili system protein ChpB (putative protein-glutamate methylesterase)
VVAEGDPAELDPDTVSQLGPTVVVVSLEPAIEPALERFDDLLGTAGVEVMYDDAEVTGKLEGWDLARWARHLAAKLLGRDLQPPPPEDAHAEPEMHPIPGLPPTPAQLMDGAKLEDYTAESPELAEWVPTNPSLTGDAPAVEEDAAPRAQESDELPDFDLDMSGIESAMADLPDIEMPAAPAPAAAAADEFSFDGDFSLELGGLEDFIGKDEAPTPAKPAAKEEPLLADLEFDSGSINFADFAPRDDGHEAAHHMDADVAALAAQLEEFEKADTRETARDPDFSWAPNDDAAKAKEMRATPPRTSAPMPEVPAPPEKSFEFGSLSLVDDDTIPVEPIKPKPVAAPNFDSLNLSLEDLDDTAVKAKAIRDAAMAAKSTPAPTVGPPKINFDTGSLSLETVDVEPREGSGVDEFAPMGSAPGAVLVVAGMGGPDAVRQFLSHLPHTLPVPVLLYQHLEVAKVSRMPVYLAVAGESAQPGKVAVLPAGMGADAVGDGLRFTPGPLDALVREMPAADSVLVVLSGADPSLVPAATALRNGGGQAFAQTPDSCFDATAAQSLANAGASAMPSAQIAARVAARWPA